MHLLALALLSILAGTLLLAKVKKEALGKLFTYFSWFFLVVGFVLFLGCIAGGICKMAHHCGGPGQSCPAHGMMMKDGCHDKAGEKCCPPGKFMTCPDGKGMGCPEGKGMEPCCKKGAKIEIDTVTKTIIKRVEGVPLEKPVTKTK